MPSNFLPLCKMGGSAIKCSGAGESLGGILYRGWVRNKLKYVKFAKVRLILEKEPLGPIYKVSTLKFDDFQATPSPVVHF